MGRELRKVPPNWEHPKSNNSYIPMGEEQYSEVINKWIENHKLWEEGKHPDQLMSENAKDFKYYVQWHGSTPDIEQYNHYYTPEEATWYQLYENVSEGTPVSPPFETMKELAEYLALYGDFWYQEDTRRGRDTFRTKPTLEQVYSLLQSGCAPSFLIANGKMLDAYQMQDIKKGGKK